MCRSEWVWRCQTNGGGKYENPKEQKKPYDNPDKPQKRTNRPDDERKPTTCHKCGSKFHYLNKYPDRNERAFLAQEEIFIDKPVLFMDDKNELRQFTQGALNCAALDIFCSSSVSGLEWKDIYLELMDEAIRDDR